MMMMKHFQMHGPWPEKLLPQKIPDLYQRNQDIVYDRKQITFNPFCLIFSLQIKRKTSYILENSCIVTKCQVCQFFFFFSIYQLPVIYSLKCIFSLFSTNHHSTNNIFFSSSHLLTPLTNCSCSSSIPVQ